MEGIDLIFNKYENEYLLGSKFKVSRYNMKNALQYIIDNTSKIDNKLYHSDGKVLLSSVDIENITVDMLMPQLKTADYMFIESHRGIRLYLSINTLNKIIQDKDMDVVILKHDVLKLKPVIVVKEVADSIKSMFPDVTVIEYKDEDVAINDSRFYIDYENDEDEFPILFANGLKLVLSYNTLDVPRDRLFYFKGVKDSITTQSNAISWINIQGCSSSSIQSNFIYSQLVRAFSVDLDILDELVKDNFGILVKFLYKVFQYYGIKLSFSIYDINTAKPFDIEEVVSVYKVYNRRRKINNRALMYLLDAGLYDKIRYLKEYELKLNNYLSELSKFGVEYTFANVSAALLKMPKEFKATVGLVDAGGLVYLFKQFIGYVESLHLLDVNSDIHGVDTKNSYFINFNGKESKVVETIKQDNIPSCDAVKIEMLNSYLLSKNFDKLTFNNMIVSKGIDVDVDDIGKDIGKDILEYNRLYNLEDKVYLVRCDEYGSILTTKFDDDILLANIPLDYLINLFVYDGVQGSYVTDFRYKRIKDITLNREEVSLIEQDNIKGFVEVVNTLPESFGDMKLKDVYEFVMKNYNK